MTGSILFNLFKRNRTARRRMGVPNTLSGYFELRVDRIVGWVRDAHGSHVASMQIEIFGPGGIIASFAATAQPEQRRFVFSFPIGDRFTGAELIREEVFIVARDSEGNSGRILLDGAAQLELIREHLGVPASVILDLDFSLGGNARSYLGAGWSGEETNYTCTVNDESFVSFDTPLAPGTYALRMTVIPVIRKPTVPAQTLTVFIDEAQVGQFVYHDDYAQFNECKFPHDQFARAPRTTLRLHHPDAVCQSDLGLNSDSRRLAFCFKRLTLVRPLPPQGGTLNAHQL